MTRGLAVVVLIVLLWPGFLPGAATHLPSSMPVPDSDQSSLGAVFALRDRTTLEPDVVEELIQRMVRGTHGSYPAYVRVDGSHTIGHWEATLAGLEATVHSWIPTTNAPGLLIRAMLPTRPEALDALSREPGLVYVASASLRLSSELESLSHDIHSYEVSAGNWQGLSATGRGIRLAIVDSGYEFPTANRHPALKEPAHTWCGGFFCSAIKDASAEFHGTKIGGLIASQDATRKGIAPGVDLGVFKPAETPLLESWEDSAAAAFDDALNWQADIISMSQGVFSGVAFHRSGDSPISHEAASAVSRGPVFVKSSGNGGGLAQHARAQAPNTAGSPGTDCTRAFCADFRLALNVEAFESAVVWDAQTTPRLDDVSLDLYRIDEADPGAPILVASRSMIECTTLGFVTGCSFSRTIDGVGIGSDLLRTPALPAGSYRLRVTNLGPAVSEVSLYLYPRSPYSDDALVSRFTNGGIASHTVSAPGDREELVVVGAVTAAESAVASYSSAGPNQLGVNTIDLLAVGAVANLPAYDSNGWTWARGEGTSFSAPQVAAALALWAEIAGDHPSAGVMTLVASARPAAGTHGLFPPELETGAGILHVLRAFKDDFGLSTELTVDASIGLSEASYAVLRAPVLGRRVGPIATEVKRDGTIVATGSDAVVARLRGHDMGVGTHVIEGRVATDDPRAMSTVSAPSLLRVDPKGERELFSRADPDAGYFLASDDASFFTSATVFRGSGAGGRNIVTRAYDQATGVERWVAEFGSPNLESSDVASSIAVDGISGIVYVGGTADQVSRSSRSRPTVIAYSTAGGDALWTWSLGTGAPLGGGVDKVIVGADSIFALGREYEQLQGVPWCCSETPVLYALEKHTGAVLWTRRYNDTPSRPLDAVISRDGAYLFTTASELGAGFPSGRITSRIRLDDGAREWFRVTTPLQAADDPGDPRQLVLSDEGSMLFLTGLRDDGQAQTTVALSAIDGTEVWRTSSPGNGIFLGRIAQGPSNSQVVVAHGFQSSPSVQAIRVLALDAKTGALDWEALLRPRLGRQAWPYWIGSDASNGIVLVVGAIWESQYDGDGIVWAIDGSTGEDAWVITHNGGPYSSEAFWAAQTGQNRVVVAGGRLAAYATN